ncbi:MAG: SDR family NAD(P)-dependent oxidoreductase [Pseudomonadota bacterium]
MNKTIVLTGATDGIGFETAIILAKKNHKLLLHGRNELKLKKTKEIILEENREAIVETFVADLSQLSDVEKLVENIQKNYASIDVLINNAGVFKMPNPILDSGYDARFIVNAIAPYVLTKKLLPAMKQNGRIINLSSAAQATVDIEALQGKKNLTDNAAYAQSKLAITMWSFDLAQQLKQDGPTVIAVNPASFLGSKMVKEAYGSEGKDLMIGANILVKAALDEDFAGITGRYFDNDQGAWSEPHEDALDNTQNTHLVKTIHQITEKLGIKNL